jgi:hypothetical protein
MKKLILLGLAAGAAYGVAKKFNITSVDDVKKLVEPYLK